MEEFKTSLGVIQGLKKNNLGFKIILGIFFGICLASLFHFRYVRVRDLNLNSLSKNYILAEKDFDFPDDEATMYLKYHKTSNINSIYFIDSNQIKQKRCQLEKYLIDNPSWRDLTCISYEKINDLADLFENILVKARFSDTATIKQMKEYEIYVANYFALDLKDNKNFILPKGYFSIFSTKISTELINSSQDAIHFLSNFFELNDYNLKEDYKTQSKIKKTIEKNIPQQYRHINAGEFIIGKGERVTQTHINMLQNMKVSLAKKRNLFEPITILGHILFSFIFLLIMLLYLKIEHPDILNSLKQLALICTIMILTFVFARAMEFIVLKSSGGFLAIIKYPIIVPFAALLFSILFNMRLSLFFSCMLSIILNLVLTVEPPNAFLIINFVTSMMIIFFTRAMRKRTEVFEVCSKCMLSVILILLSVNFMKNKLFHIIIIEDTISALIYLSIIAVIVVALLPVLEAFFDVLTDITLMEYLDPNNELLRRISIETPGSYQHSLVLGNLSEAAAQRINANALFCRVAAMYHDIGKLSNPDYYIENQESGVNIHQLLTPVESAQMIICHLEDGEILANKYRLPKKISDVIVQHHGTTIVNYFYRKELQLHPRGEIDVDENLFRYPGPKPQSKEAAIIMIADATEAASRSMDGSCRDSFTKLVDDIVKEKTDDKQFDDCHLTFKELETIKKSFVNTLMLTRHIRIKYPEKKEQKLTV